MDTRTISVLSILAASACATHNNAAEPPSQRYLQATRWKAHQDRAEARADHQEAREQRAQGHEVRAKFNERQAQRDERDAREQEHKLRAAGEPVYAAGEQDRVTAPEHRDNRHLASAGSDLPANKQDPNAPPRAGVYDTRADNTRVNERDRAAEALTPMDQGESQADRELVQRIRKAVISEDVLSFSAKNVKIITRDGHVTLRGPVKNETEKAIIEKDARDAAGAKNVTSQLEIAD